MGTCSIVYDDVESSPCSKYGNDAASIDMALGKRELFCDLKYCDAGLMELNFPLNPVLGSAAAAPAVEFVFVLEKSSVCATVVGELVASSSLGAVSMPFEVSLSKESNNARELVVCFCNPPSTEENEF